MNCARLAPQSSIECWAPVRPPWAAIAGSVLWALGVCLLPLMAWAQTPQPELGPGARVRVHNAALSEPVVVGQVVALSGDTLTLAPSGTRGELMRVLLDDRTRVDLNTEHHNRLGRGLLIGGLVGGGIGAVIVGVQQASTVGEDLGAGLLGLPPRHEEASTAPIIVGLVAGCTLGGLIGASLLVDRWVPVKTPLRISLGIAGAAAQVRLTVSLPKPLSPVRD